MHVCMFAIHGHLILHRSTSNLRRSLTRTISWSSRVCFPTPPLNVLEKPKRHFKWSNSGRGSNCPSSLHMIYVTKRSVLHLPRWYSGYSVLQILTSWVRFPQTHCFFSFDLFVHNFAHFTEETETVCVRLCECVSVFPLPAISQKPMKQMLSHLPW